MNVEIPNKEEWFGASNLRHYATHRMSQKNGTKKRIKQTLLKYIVY